MSLQDLKTLPDIASYARELQALGYTKQRTWSLGETCEHIGSFIQDNVDDRHWNPPLPIRIGLRYLLLPFIKWSESFPPGLPAPPGNAPQLGHISDEDGICKLERAVDQFEHSSLQEAKTHLGRMTRPELTILHLIHAKHHLKNLVPRR